MRRGLDGFLLLPGLMRFLRSTEAVSKPFGGEIARGKHLFPFRTEPLSLSAPMVLGGQPPGRVGRRRLFLTRPAGRHFFVRPAESRAPRGRQHILARWRPPGERRRAGPPQWNGSPCWPRKSGRAGPLEPRNVAPPNWS